MSSLTVYLARFIGLGCLLLCAALAARPKLALAAISSMMQQPGLLLVTGIFTMAAGVALVLAHNLWTGGALSVVVTAIGWLALIKGLALIAAPAQLARFYAVIGHPGRLRMAMAGVFLLSIWLTWAAFTAGPSIAV